MYAGLPGIKHVGEVKHVGVGEVYVGRGQAALKLPRSDLSPPYTAEADGTAEYCVRCFAQIAETELEWQGRIARLATQAPPVHTLLVDEPPGRPSHAEVLAYLVWQQRESSAGQKPTGRTGPSRARPKRRAW